MTNKEKILVTGAGGFIGGRIVELLHLSGKYRVHAGLRRWESAPRVARFSVELVLCDILKSEQLTSAMRDIDVVIHCAAGSNEVTVNGTENVLQAALRSKARRVIHISTVDVYGDAKGDVDEQTPLKYTGKKYANMKIDAEKACKKYMKQGLSVTIVRPSIVYGPFSKLWTTRFAHRLASGTWGTIDKLGEGLCNLVYIDDLVAAIEATINNDSASGQVFIVNGAEVVTWNKYFVLLNRELNFPEIKTIQHKKIRAKSIFLQPVRKTCKWALDHFNQTIMKIYSKYYIAKIIFKVIEKKLKTTPVPNELELYSKNVCYSIQKAKVILGFEPRFNVQKGIAMSAAWYKHHT